jgi:arylsulfatase A
MLSTHFQHETRGVKTYESTRSRFVLPPYISKVRLPKLIAGEPAKYEVSNIMDSIPKKIERLSIRSTVSFSSPAALMSWPIALILGWTAFLADSATGQPVRPPNVVFILCDNLGNGDIGCFNEQTKHRTPNIDRLAREGCKLTSYYSASGVCSPSRAALATGCYPLRIGMHTSYEKLAVLKPVDKIGLNPRELTIAELLKQAGYATAYYGKWHLGDQPEFLPLNHGYDTYLGIPYSEDMLPGIDRNRPWPPLPLIQDSKVIEAPTEAQLLTKRLTEASVEFIRSNREKPFFLLFSETGPGSRRECFPGPDFEGKSANGLYGDAIEELDWSMGEVMKAIEENGLTQNTLVVWTTDNGAVSRNPPQGSNAPYNGFCNSTNEGAMRVPCIVRWPGVVKAATTCDELCTMMDWLPTFAKLVDQPLPDHPIDGHDLAPLLFAETTGQSRYDETGFYYYQGDQLQAVRSGPWKLYLPLDEKGLPGKAKKSMPQSLSLFDVRHDPHETVDYSQGEPEVVKRLLSLAEVARNKIGDGDQGAPGQRASGWIEEPVPAVLK